MIEHDPLVCGIAAGQMPLRCRACHEDALRVGCKPNSSGLIIAADYEARLVKVKPAIRVNGVKR